METNLQNSSTSPVPAPTNNPNTDGSGKPGLTEGVWSIVCAVMALGFFPIILGPVAIYLAYRAKKKGRVTLGTIGIAVGVACTIIGMVVGVIVTARLERH